MSSIGTEDGIGGLKCLEMEWLNHNQNNVTAFSRLCGGLFFYGEDISTAFLASGDLNLVMNGVNACLNFIYVARHAFTRKQGTWI